MKIQKKKYPWKDKIVNYAQIGGIETSVLDNGLGRNVRIAWFNTGSGLRFQLVIDRALDIAAAFYNQHSLAWLSHAGVSAPRPDAHRSLEWLSTFMGGLLTTCGLTHIGGPQTDEYGQRGLHGRISNLPATIESIVQPDPISGKLDMSMTATIKESTVFGPNLELKRTISGRLGESVIRIHDRVTNRGNTKSPHMILYHCNFGWPLVDEGTGIIWQGQCSPMRPEDRKIFNAKHDFHRVPAPRDDHRGAGEACAAIDIKPDTKGTCIAGLYNKKLGLAVALKFKKNQLPWLANWQHWGPGEYVTGLEPGTNPPIGQAQARENKQLIYLGPGKSRSYDLEISVLTEKKQIDAFDKCSANV